MFVAIVSVLPAVDKFLLGSDWLVDNMCKWDFVERTIKVGYRLIRAQHTFNDVCQCNAMQHNCVVPP